VFGELLFNVVAIIDNRNVGRIKFLSAATFSEDGFPVTVFDHSEMRAMGERFHGCGLSHKKSTPSANLRPGDERGEIDCA